MGLMIRWSCYGDNKRSRLSITSRSIHDPTSLSKNSVTFQSLESTDSLCGETFSHFHSSPKAYLPPTEHNAKLRWHSLVRFRQLITVSLTGAKLNTTKKRKKKSPGELNLAMKFLLHSVEGSTTKDINIIAALASEELNTRCIKYS